MAEGTVALVAGVLLGVALFGVALLVVVRTLGTRGFGMAFPYG